MYTIGISAYYHDSACAVLKDDKIIAAAQEERFSRRKHDSSFPADALSYCLSEAGIGLEDAEAIAFYDKPFLKFERLLQTYVAEAPRGLRSFVMSMPVWLKEKLFLKNTLVRELREIDDCGKKLIESKIRFAEHHVSHAASAFYPSPFGNAAILTIDGVGEWTTTSLAYGSGKDIIILKEIHFPHSLGLLYSAFTYYTGFKVNSGEYKVMGLAPYGEPVYESIIRNKLIDIREDGSFKLNMDYFNYTTGLTMTNRRFDDLFGGPPRKRESKLTQKEMDLAASIQSVTEDIIFKLARHARSETGSRNLCLAGGVALNCVSNGKVLKEKIFDKIWIQPAAGDAGGALGAAYAYYFSREEAERKANSGDRMRGSYLGPEFGEKQIVKSLSEFGAEMHRHGDKEIFNILANALAEGKVIGWMRGRMEFGPRALGSRSIIGDARNSAMQKTMNLKIKFRESFRPFAPSVLAARCPDYFYLDEPSPYMLLVSEVRHELRKSLSDGEENLFGIEKLNVPRSEIPAVTHVDYSARVQTVHGETNPPYHSLIKAFEKKTGCGVIVNTSFNVRGEPIVCSPEDAYRCFMRTEMDILAIGPFLLYKEEQPAISDDTEWEKEFELD